MISILSAFQFILVFAMCFSLINTLQNQKFLKENQDNTKLQLHSFEDRETKDIVFQDKYVELAYFHGETLSQEQQYKEIFSLFVKVPENKNNLLIQLIREPTGGFNQADLIKWRSQKTHPAEKIHYHYHVYQYIKLQGSKNDSFNSSNNTAISYRQQMTIEIIINQDDSAVLNKLNQASSSSQEDDSRKEKRKYIQYVIFFIFAVFFLFIFISKINQASSNNSNTNRDNSMQHIQANIQANTDSFIASS